MQKGTGVSTGLSGMGKEATHGESSSTERAGLAERILHRGLILFLVATVVFLLLDLGTKRLAFSRLGPRGNRRVVVIPGFLDLITSQNEGAAFGILKGRHGFFVGISFLAALLLSYFSMTGDPKKKLYHFTLGLILAGVLGNLYDRLFFVNEAGRHAVRDFIDLHIDHPPIARFLQRTFGSNHWPNFNVADAAICVGAFLMIVFLWREDRAEKAGKKQGKEGKRQEEKRQEEKRGKRRAEKEENRRNDS
jgi:signal peptidase II